MTRPASPAFDWLNGEIGALRRQYERCFAAVAAPESWETINRADGCLRLLLQRPQRSAVPDHAILYFHGGGWIVGSPLTHADISGALCDATGMTVYSVDYRLAPEHPAPAPVADGCLALSALFRTDHIANVVLCGDSAGAAIALAVERHAAGDAGRIRGVCSFYGCFGLRDSPSLREFGSRTDGTDAACIQRMWTLAHAPQGHSPYAIDALATPAGAPVYLLAAGRDPLRDDTLALASAYRACSRSHDLDLVEGAAHGFLHDGDRSDVAIAAIGRASAWILSKCRQT